MKAINKIWKESSSLIILSSRKSLPVKSFNYDCLVLKRSSNSSFMANAIVFPGGIMEPADSKQNWMKLYENLGVEKSRLTGMLTQHSGFIFTKTNEKEDLEREISLRITAIRETFEEVGILIAKTKKEFEDKDSTYSTFVKDFDIRQWQKDVAKDPEKFIELCDNLQVAPDVFALQSWANWLTPTQLGKRRFDAAFFVVCLPERPNVVMDPKEVDQVLWATPSELIQESIEEKIWLPPPQSYELSRLNNAPNLETLAKFVKWRNQFGTELFFPVLYQMKGKVMHVLPGDDLYPKEPNLYKKEEDFDKYAEKTSEELQKMSKNLHRTEHENLFKAQLLLNFPPARNHICPLNINNKFNDLLIKAKL